MVSFPPVSPPRPYTPPSPHPYAPHAQPISFFSILSPAQYWGEEYRLFRSSLYSLLHSSFNFKMKLEKKIRHVSHPLADVNRRLKTNELEKRFVYCGAMAQLGPRQVCRSHSVIIHTTLGKTPPDE